MANRYHALIVGAGVAGPACALSLRALGYRVTLVEAHPDRAKAGAALMVAPNGMAMLGRLGLADAIVAAGSPIERFRFLSQRGRRIATMRTTPDGRYQYPGVSISRAKLYGIVLEAVSRGGVEIGFGKRLVGLEQHADVVTTRFSDGAEISADIVIGADGLHSCVRRLAFPEAPAPDFAGLIGGGGFLPRSVMARIVGPGQDGVMTFSSGDDAFFGCAFGDRAGDCGAYWWYSLRQARPVSNPDRDALAGDRAARVVLSAGKGWSKLVREIIGATTTYIPPMDIFDAPAIPRWSNGRCVLVGDAAHAVAPHSGQGASMALEDAVVLAQALEAHSHDPLAAFKSFEDDRRPRTERVIEMGRRTGERKARGWMSARIQTLMMPLFIRLAPPQDWLFGYEPLTASVGRSPPDHSRTACIAERTHRHGDP